MRRIVKGRSSNEEEGKEKERISSMQNEINSTLRERKGRDGKNTDESEARS